jgi:hypothetical protein
VAARVLVDSIEDFAPFRNYRRLERARVQVEQFKDGGGNLGGLDGLGHGPAFFRARAGDDDGHVGVLAIGASVLSDL